MNMGKLSAIALALSSGTALAQSDIPNAVKALGYSQQMLGPDVSIGKNWSVTQGANVQQNSDGSVTIAGGPNSFNLHMTSTPKFTGGMYMQAKASFTGTPTQAGGWPAVWALPVQGTYDANSAHSELDIMEVMGNNFGTAIHDWAADGSASKTSTNTPQIPSSSIDFSKPHTFGALVIPAEANSQGSVTWFFDSKEIGQVRFNQGDPWSDLGTQTNEMLLGSGPSNPMTVYSAEVWQAPQGAAKLTATKATGKTSPVQPIPGSLVPVKTQPPLTATPVTKPTQAALATVEQYQAPNWTAVVPPAGDASQQRAEQLLAQNPAGVAAAMAWLGSSSSPSAAKGKQQLDQEND